MVPTQILMDNYANDATGDELTSLPEFRYGVPQQVAAWRTNKNNLITQAAAARPAAGVHRAAPADHQGALEAHRREESERGIALNGRGKRVSVRIARCAEATARQAAAPRATARARHGFLDAASSARTMAWSPRLRAVSIGNAP